MKANFFLLVGLGLAAGVRAAPVPRTPALARNFNDKLDIRHCALARRAEDDDLPVSSQTEPQAAQHEGAPSDRYKNREDPNTAEARKTRKRKHAAYQRNRYQKFAIENPDKFKRQKEVAAAKAKTRKMALAAEHPEEFQRWKADKAAQTRARRIAIAAKHPEAFKHLKEVHAVREKDRRTAAKLAIAHDPKLVAEMKARKSVQNRSYRENKAAKQQAPTQALPSMQLATSCLAEARAKKSIHNRCHPSKKAKQQALAQALLSEHASPSMQLLIAASCLAEATVKKSARSKCYYQSKKVKQQALIQAHITQPVSPSMQQAVSSATLGLSLQAVQPNQEKPNIDVLLHL
jgi:hypothetical protein